jgi:hypothetical protein
MAINVKGGRERGLKQRSWVTFSENTANDFTIVSAPGAGYRVVVMTVDLHVAGAQGIDLKSNATSLRGEWTGGGTQNHEYLRDGGDYGLWSCADNEPLVVTLSNAVLTEGTVSYIIEDSHE